MIPLLNIYKSVREADTFISNFSFLISNLKSAPLLRGTKTPESCTVACNFFESLHEIS